MNRTEYRHSIGELDAAQWNALGAADNPFTRYEFLAALEHAAAKLATASCPEGPVPKPAGSRRSRLSERLPPMAMRAESG